MFLKPSCATDVRHALRRNGDYPKQVSLQWRIQAFRKGGASFWSKYNGGVPPPGPFPGSATCLPKQTES